jgi:hypothetical protein
MDASFKANPRFDPQRNAAALGLRSIPIFFLGGADTAGSTDATATESNDWGPRVPWLRIATLAVIVWAVWKLAK